MEQQNKVSSRCSPWNRKSPPLKPKFKTASKLRVIKCKKSDKLKLQPSNSFDPIRWKTSSTYALDRIRWHFHIVNWLQQMKPNFVFTLSVTCGHPLVPHQCEPLTKGCRGPQPTCRRLKPLYLLGSPREAERVTLLSQPPTAHFFTFFPLYGLKSWPPRLHQLLEPTLYQTLVIDKWFASTLWDG